MTTTTPEKLKLFISYSRADMKTTDALEAAGFAVLIATPSFSSCPIST